MKKVQEKILRHGNTLLMTQELLLEKILRDVVRLAIRAKGQRSFPSGSNRVIASDAELEEIQSQML